MTRHTWKRKIKRACTEAGTYKQSFDITIETLARILERRDNARAAFEEHGKQLFTTHTNKAGQENEIKHPAVALENEMNRDALTYLRDLGLTPAGFKRLNEGALNETKKETSLEAALQKLGGS